jgi:ABC-type bacteriocin/lantibiotic exporter with double-glycine peptidase domain
MFGVLVLSAGCATGAPALDAGQDRARLLYVPHVPFFAQSAYQCGPAALASVLNYWGTSASPDEIAGVVYSSRLKGTLGWDLWSYSRSRGFDARMQAGTAALLRESLAAGSPVIALLDDGYSWLPMPHFVVVVGIDTHNGDVICYDGYQPDAIIPAARFHEAWRKAGFWTLTIRPPSGGAAHDSAV